MLDDPGFEQRRVLSGFKSTVFAGILRPNKLLPLKRVYYIGNAK